MNRFKGAINLIIDNIEHEAKEAEERNTSFITLSRDDTNAITQQLRQVLDDVNKDNHWEDFCSAPHWEQMEVVWFIPYNLGVAIKEHDRGYAGFYYMANGGNYSLSLIDDTYDSDPSDGTDKVKKRISKVLGWNDYV